MFNTSVVYLIAEQKGVRTSKVKSVFDVEIANRRNQACRSILVQVYSINSQNELYDYCAQFGEILSMHHYHIDKQHVRRYNKYQNVFFFFVTIYALIIPYNIFVYIVAKFITSA